jgi:hypothetical protein
LSAFDSVNEARGWRDQLSGLAVAKRHSDAEISLEVTVEE